MNLIQTYTLRVKTVLNNYILISILSKHMQSSYLAKNFYIIFMLILALASYLILSTGVFHYLERFKYYDQIYNLIIVFTILDLLFLQFNLLVRVYFMICKGIPHYLNKVRLSNSRRLNGKVMMHYFTKNIILILLSFYAILRITHILVGLNYLDNDLHLCINLISISLFLYYIIRYLEFSWVHINYTRTDYRVFESICSGRSFINIYVLCINCILFKYYNDIL